MINIRREQLAAYGFTLIEMVIVIIITGIIGSMTAMFLKAPIEQFMDVGRRADMTDIADTALRRVARDVRLALPNSVRSTSGTCPSGIGTCRFLEFLPTSGGGRYRNGAGGGAGCPAPSSEKLDFTAADTCFGVLGGMPTGFTFTPGDLVAIYNMGSGNANAYAASNTAAVSAIAGNIITLGTAKQFPYESHNARFDVINKPVSYVCDPNESRTLTRYWGYVIQPNQPTSAVQLATGATSASALLATNVTTCTFAYDGFVVTNRYGLVTMILGITETSADGASETIRLYSATHVSNSP